MYRPATLPAVKKLVVSEDGDVWLQRQVLESGAADWLILDPEGVPVATASTPETLDVRRIRDGWVWGVEIGDLDVTFVVGHPLEESR